MLLIKTCLAQQARRYGGVIRGSCPPKSSMIPHRQYNIKKKNICRHLELSKKEVVLKIAWVALCSNKSLSSLGCLMILESLVMIVREFSRDDNEGILQSACVSEIALKALRKFQTNFILNSDFITANSFKYQNNKLNKELNL